MLKGTGAGLSFTPCVVILGDYFKTRLSFANGVALAGSGVGGLIAPVLYDYLIDTYELRGALLIFGALALNICVARVAMSPKEFYDRSTKITLNDEFVTEPSLLIGNKSTELSRLSKDSSQSSKVFQDEKSSGGSILHRIYWCVCFLPANDEGCRKPLFDWTIFKSPIYYVYAIALIFAAISYTSVFVITPSFAVEEGLGGTSAAFLVSCIGFADLTGRVVISFLMDYSLIQKKYVLFGSFLICGVNCVVFPFADQFGWMVAVGVVLGFFGGTYVPLTAVVFVEALGVDKLASAYGFAIMSQGIAILIAQPLIGVLSEATGSWVASYWTCAVSFFLASLCGIFEPTASRQTKPPNSPK